MKNRRITTMLLAVSALLALADAVSAYYSPRLGRFLSRDPIAEPGAVLVRQATRPATSFIPRDPIGEGADGNTYRFVDNNPVILIDPSGLHVIGVGVAQAFGASHGQKWRDTVAELAEFEQSLYDELGVAKGDRYNNGQLDYFDNPASDAVFPDWKNGTDGLRTRLQAFAKYYATTRKAKCKAEIVHILGYSDGATVVARWLNANAPGAWMIYVPWGELPYGTVGLVDVVRKRAGLPNQSPGKTYEVATAGHFSEFISFSSEGGKWKGYQIVSGWEHQTYKSIDHKLIAYDESVKASLRTAIERSVRDELGGQAFTIRHGW